MQFLMQFLSPSPRQLLLTMKIASVNYSQTSTNGHLSTTARTFCPNCAPIYTLYSYCNLPTMATSSLQWPDNSTPGWPLWRSSTVAAISVRFVARISLRCSKKIAPKSPLVYTCDFHRELERDKSCLGERNKNCMCKWAF